jgi:hypothetical protein
MATVATPLPPTSELAVERLHEAIDADLSGVERYPDGAEFIAADLLGAGALIASAARELRPVVLVYPDGDERLLLAVRKPMRMRHVLEAGVRTVRRRLRHSRLR